MENPLASVSGANRQTKAPRIVQVQDLIDANSPRVLTVSELLGGKATGRPLIYKGKLYATTEVGGKSLLKSVVVDKDGKIDFVSLLARAVIRYGEHVEYCSIEPNPLDEAAVASYNGRLKWIRLIDKLIAAKDVFLLEAVVMEADGELTQLTKYDKNGDSVLAKCPVKLDTMEDSRGNIVYRYAVLDFQLPDWKTVPVERGEGDF